MAEQMRRNGRLSPIPQRHPLMPKRERSPYSSRWLRREGRRSTSSTTARSVPLSWHGSPRVVLGVFALYLIWPMVRACATGVAIEITSLGLVNHTGGVTFVGWHEIESARIGSPWGRKVVELDLHNPDVVLQRIGSLRGWSIRSYVKKYGGKPSINAYAAEGGAEAVLAEIRNRLGGMQITGLPRS
jgi:hypothetical protein